MNTKDLIRLGVPPGEPTRRGIDFISRYILKGLDKARLAEDVEAVVRDPGAYVEDELRGEFAQALLRCGRAIQEAPATWRQWGEGLEPEALNQMGRACQLPVAVAGALMPDAHVGYGLPIGGVLATENAVIPYAVGVDIACRMKLTVLDLPLRELERQREKLIKAIEGETRFGVGATFKQRREHEVLDADWSISPPTKQNRDRAWAQLGTSGSGNHFVEFGVFTAENPIGDLPAGEYVALLSHSGSRGTGAAVCDHFSKLAMAQHPELPKEHKHLAWLSLASAEGRAYWAAMELVGLSAAASGGRLKGLPGLGEKSEAKIRKGLEDLKGRKIAVRTPLGVAWELAEAVRAALRDAPGLERLETGGSLRRMKETVGDLDFLAAAADAAPVMDRLAESPLVEEVLLRGPTKMSVRFRGGMQGDLRVVERSRWGTAWQYFTGSQAHNVTLRELSIKKGYSLSEYALKKADGSELLCAEEEEVYRALGMPWIPPELREGRGEIEAAIKGELPRLLEVSDLKGDLQSHTTASDGRASLPEMAQAAMERNLAYLLVTDHSQGLAVAGGLSPEDLRRQCAEIRELEKSLGGKFRLLCGTEVEVRSDGSLDFPDDVLGGLDLVVAAVHSALSGDPEKVTGRFLSAVRHPLVHVLAHPTGRLLTGRGRSGADADWDRVFAEAAATGTALEINASPMRLDLTDTLARRALELGCLFAVSTDAHAPEQFDFAHFGVAVARRAWIPPERGVNTWEADRLLEWARGKPARVAALGR